MCPWVLVSICRFVISALLAVEWVRAPVCATISASGGVYVGVAAETIVANPGTITGSIGVILRGTKDGQPVTKMIYNVYKNSLVSHTLQPLVFSHV